MSDLVYIPGAIPSAYIRIGQAFSLTIDDDERQFPPNWLEQATDEDLTTIGGTKVVVEGEHKDPRLYDNTEEFDGAVHRLIATPWPTEQIQAQLLSHLADRRWRAEVGGTLWNGWQLATDERSQGKYLAELAAVNEGVRVDGSPWKFPHGFESLSNQQVREMAIAARGHVLASYAKEAELAVGIGAGVITSFEEIDTAFGDEAE